MAEEAKPTEGVQETTQGGAADGKTTATEPEKTFTQVDVDKIISERLKREREKMPSEEDLKAYGEWKKAQQTEAEKAAEREAQLAKYQADNEALRRENLVIRAGVRSDDVDYVLFKVGKLEGEFDKNLEAFLAENKKYTEPETEVVQGIKHSPSMPDDDSQLTESDRLAMGLPSKKKG